LSWTLNPFSKKIYRTASKENTCEIERVPRTLGGDVFAWKYKNMDQRTRRYLEINRGAV
jgi:hypothetical protein